VIAGGTRFGAFTIVRQIGAGSMGVVYEARQDSPQRHVALKVVRTGLAAETLRRRLEHEASALARLQHPGIAAVHEVGVDAGSGAPYIAMELVRGETLTRHAAGRGLGVAERVELLASICDAVQHAHQRGVIHRDLKPSNILVDEAGRARVLDFGIARITEQDRESTLRTLPGQVIGTLAYMSPEQAAGDPDAVDVRADVYALGAIGYELLAGAPPLDVVGNSIPEALRIIHEESARRLGTVDRRLRGDIETIIAKALEKGPEGRYQSAVGLAGDLRRAMRDEPIIARAPTTFYQLRKFARRRRGLVAAAGAIAATLVLAAIISMIFAISAERQRARAERRFGDVRTLANTMLFDMHDLIAPLGGSIEARRRLVETGLTYLDSLAAEAGDDPELLEELAEAYFRIGDIQGNPRNANLGDVDAALASYDASVELRRLAARLDPSVDRTLALVRSWIAIGETLTSSRRAREALERFELAQSELGGLGESVRDDVAVRETRALAEGRIGSVLRDMGRPSEALAHFEASLAISDELAASGALDRVRQVTIALNEVGLTLARLDRHTDALEPFARSLEIRRLAAERDPESARAQRDLATVNQRLADVRLALGEPERGLEHHVDARKALGAIARADPNDSRARFDLSVAEEKVGTALVDLGRFGEAVDSYGRSAALRGALAGENPDNLFYKKAQSAAVERQAHALRLTGDHGAARVAYREAIDLARECNEQDASDARTWTVVVAAQRGLGESYLETRGADPEGIGEARRCFEASLSVLAAMRERGMTPVRGNMNEKEIGALLAQCSDG
jgi:tetratricopeptide (TPR) repeat protein